MIVYLIGMSGVGKTTIGKKLSQQLNYQFLDLDKVIELSSHLSITEIFNQFGENHFRKLEQEELLKTFALNNYIIATGGGTPCFFDNMKLMKQNGKTIYLQLNPSTIFNRFEYQEIAKRPLLKKEKEFIELFESRKNFYNQADIKLDVNIDDYLNILIKQIKLISTS